MNYEQKYKEALERMKSWTRGEHPECFTEAQKAAEFIFPELKEDEDELEWLKQFIQEEAYILSMDIRDDEDSFRLKKLQKSLAWLEKQGKQKETICEQKPINDIQKPTDIKFHEGDFIKHNKANFICKVISANSAYYVENIETSGRIELFNAEQNFHLWTIQDAKPGDVLCDCHEAYDNPLIFILKKFEHVDFGLVRPSDYSSYCYLTAGDIQRFKEGTYHHEHNIKPATKEQRALLFQKMKEAGYEWDNEKKELKKIEKTRPMLSDFFNAEYERGKASFANRQVYNRAILAILSNYVEEYPDIRFWQMLCNLGIGPVFNEESRETYCNLNETINKSKDESKN